MQIAALADHPSVTVGAGTVLTADQASEACAAGAAFLVAPGFDKPTVEFARSAAVPIVPGIATASELQAAWNFGLEFVKVFPASTLGGPPALRMLASICAGMRFMPTGGIGVDDLADYLAIPAVLACGGTWLASASAIAEAISTVSHAELQRRWRLRVKRSARVDDSEPDHHRLRFGVDQ